MEFPPFPPLLVIDRPPPNMLAVFLGLHDDHPFGKVDVVDGEVEHLPASQTSSFGRQ